jgi:hypothetical protein
VRIHSSIGLSEVREHINLIISVVKQKAWILFQIHRYAPFLVFGNASVHDSYVPYELHGIVFYELRFHHRVSQRFPFVRQIEAFRVRRENRAGYPLELSRVSEGRYVGGEFLFEFQIIVVRRYPLLYFSSGEFLFEYPMGVLLRREFVARPCELESH